MQSDSLLVAKSGSQDLSTDYGTTEESVSSNEHSHEDLEQNIDLTSSGFDRGYQSLRPLADFLVSCTALPQLIMVSKRQCQCTCRVKCLLQHQSSVNFSSLYSRYLFSRAPTVGIPCLVLVSCLPLASFEAETLCRCAGNHVDDWLGSERQRLRCVPTSHSCLSSKHIRTDVCSFLEATTCFDCTPLCHSLLRVMLLWDCQFKSRQILFYFPHGSKGSHSGCDWLYCLPVEPSPHYKPFESHCVSLRNWVAS